ncbi:unnamed protein product [Brassica oleracea]|uniref:(rape) hypothetical protein n=1 Tax=Brassica napus TaxID=3708 RepID=A0A816RLR7_BRANA|nr:unnamed protein product [Brassica napus]
MHIRKSLRNMNMKKCILLMMMVLIIIVTMERKVEGNSCMDKCLFLCGFFFQHPVACEDKCELKCHPPLSSQSSQMETIGMRNIRG